MKKTFNIIVKYSHFVNFLHFITKNKRNFSKKIVLYLINIYVINEENMLTVSLLTNFLKEMINKGNSDCLN